MVNESAYFAVVAASIELERVSKVDVEFGEQILIVQCKKVMSLKYEGLGEKNYVRSSIEKVLLFKIINVGDAQMGTITIQNG